MSELSGTDLNGGFFPLSWLSPNYWKDSLERISLSYRRIWQNTILMTIMILMLGSTWWVLGWTNPFVYMLLAFPYMMLMTVIIIPILREQNSDIKYCKQKIKDAENLARCPRENFTEYSPLWMDMDESSKQVSNWCRDNNIYAAFSPYQGHVNGIYVVFVDGDRDKATDDQILFKLTFI